jgi:hypothetical protein
MAYVVYGMIITNSRDEIKLQPWNADTCGL